MAISFQLSSTQNKLLKEGFDALLDNWGKTCKLVYQPKIIDCPNCQELAVNTYTNSHWGHGGPLRIDQMGCTMCGGSRKKTQEYSENITLSINWAPSEFKNVAPSTTKAFGIIQTRGYLTDLPKVQRCIEIQIQIPLENYVVGRYRLSGEAADGFNIVQDRYFLCNWERI